jgi:pyruvate formate lyase activating enzyme
MEEKKLTGKIYDIQGFSVHDGPGIRTTVFLKGCPLRCPWCHSPESQEFPTELNWMEIRCEGVEKCGRCIFACPEKIITMGEKKISLKDESEYTVVKIDRTKCTSCFKCADACPHNALYRCGTDYTVEEVIDRVKRDMPFYKRSGGGVTVSGGECLWQPQFTLELLRACKALGIHTAVDTTGYCKWEIMEQVLPYSDLFLYDLKQMDPELHKRVIGVDNAPILDNARKLAEAGAKLQIRIPTIPMFNNSRASYQAFGEFILELGDAVETVQLLPYHNLGAVKWERLGRSGPALEAIPPSEEQMQSLKKQLEDMGVKNVVIH